MDHSGPNQRPTARYLAGVAALAGAYYVAAQAGYALQFTGSIAAVWPPVGLAIGRALPRRSALVARRCDR